MFNISDHPSFSSALQAVRLDDKGDLGQENSAESVVGSGAVWKSVASDSGEHSAWRTVLVVICFLGGLIVAAVTVVVCWRRCRHTAVTNLLLDNDVKQCEDMLVDVDMLT